MKNEKLISLRKAKKLSQADLAEKAYTSISTIRNWEQNRAIPDICDIRRLAEILEVTVETMISFFTPDWTEDEEKSKKSQIYSMVEDLFGECSEGVDFVQFSYLASLGKMTSGVITCGNLLFPFTKIVADDNGYTSVFADTYNNCIVLSSKNIVKVVPVSMHYDVFSLDIVIDYPAFPIDTEHFTDSFEQAIRVSLINR